jgi:hypothetical protein
VKISINQELTRSIGSRLRESLRDCEEDLLPDAIRKGLEAIRAAEAASADPADKFVVDIRGEHSEQSEVRRSGDS